MSSAERVALFGEDSFRYPVYFDVTQYRPLHRNDKVFRMGGGPGHRFTKYRNDASAELSPAQSLNRYASTPVGQWQANQRARYPSIHAELTAEISGTDKDDEDALNNFQHTMLAMIAHDPANFRDVHRYGNQALDFHPIGHMALTAARLDHLLLHDIATTSIPPDTFLLEAVRQATALHDIDEAEHPGIKLFHGDSIGDIGANIGKSDDQRALGRNIFKHILDATYEDTHKLELREAIIAIASHDVADADKDVRVYHGLLEVNHEINTIFTARHLAQRATEVATSHPQHANIMSAIGFDSLVRAVKKRSHLIDDGLTPELAESLTENMRKLYPEATARDDDPAYIEWRAQDAVVMHFGEYDPTKLQSSLS